MITYEQWEETYADAYILSLPSEYRHDMYEDFLNVAKGEIMTREEAKEEWYQYVEDNTTKGSFQPPSKLFFAPISKGNPNDMLL